MKNVSRLFAALPMLGTALLLSAGPVEAATDKVRLVWSDDPATTMTVGWRQMSGTFSEVRYRRKGTLAPWSSETGLIEHNFQNSVNGVSDVLNNSFVKLTYLAPDTDYEFQICDSDGCSQDYRWFRSAPATPEPVTFIAGGDSRRDSNNYGPNDEARRNGFRLVAKLRPLFVLFSGDYMSDGTFDEWLIWLDEWQLTQSPDGRMYPLVPTHGNHENDELDMVRDLFNVEGPAGNSAYGTYNALSFGGDLLRIWTLNTELEQGVGYSTFQNQSATNWNAQTTWLGNDLAAHAGVTWKVVNYHRPLRPHTSSKSEGLLRYSEWAPLFDQHDVDLAIESDTHMVKYTLPVNASLAPGNDEGFVAADFAQSEHGTVFIGEGSWGAPKRPIDDRKSWTLVNNSFWQFKHISVTPSTLDVRTVRFEGSSYPNGVTSDVAEITQAQQDADPTILPAGLDLWRPFEGDGPLRLPFSAMPVVKADAETVPDTGDEPGAPPGALYYNNFSNGFDTSYGSMQLVDRGCSDANWYIYNGVKASMNGYNASASDPNEVCDDWMILPPQDLASRSAITLTFESDYNYGGPALELYYSSSYDPIGNADFSIGTTWKPLAFDLPTTDGYTLTPSGPVVIEAADIPAAERGSVYIAYRYVSTGRLSNDGRIWEVDNVAIVDGIQIPPEPTSESFDGGTLGSWQAVSVTSSNTWGVDAVGGRTAAKMNNQYAFANGDDWLVSPALGVSVADNTAEFNFSYWYQGATAQVPETDNLQLLIYPGCGLTGSYTPQQITAAPWQLLQNSFPATEAVWTDNAAIDLSAYDGQTVCLAFRYRDGGLATARTWAVDDLALGAIVPVTSDPVPAKAAGRLRVASFNTLLADRGAGALVAQLAGGNDSQARGVAEIIQRVNPDIALLNEFDYDAAGSAVATFKSQYLAVSQNGQAPVDYPYHYIAAVNTGVQPESEGDPDCDFNGPNGCQPGDVAGNGYDDPEDAYGFGNYPGAYGMVVLSKYPIDTANIRSFRKLKWQDMPGNLMPTTFYDADEQAVFRLSSKSHWDVPVNVDGEIVHLLGSHPTPPVFDGSEDRNGRRNHDEIRLWEDYVSRTGSDCYIYDDDNIYGCLGEKQRFVIMGDQNADPVYGDTFNGAILQLLNNPRVDGSFTPRSSGGAGATAGLTATADFGLRADYVLPSAAGLQIRMDDCDPADPALSCGIFWPRTGDPQRVLTGSCSASGPGCASSDHRMVWLDLAIVPDSDGDGVPDDVDSCVADANPTQDDLDHDLVGDACDPDKDGDRMLDTWEDQYQLDSSNPDDALIDSDNDGVINVDEFDNGTNPRLDENSVGPATEQVPLPAGVLVLLGALLTSLAWRIQRRG